MLLTLIILGNLLFLYVFIYIPTNNFIVLKNKENELNLEIEHFQKISSEKRKLLEKLESENNTLTENNNAEDFYYFENSYQALSFINHLLNSNNISFEIIGRDKRVKLNEKIYSTQFYISLTGAEKNIYDFFKQIENSERNIYFIRENTKLSTNGDNLKIETEIMYMDENKNNVIDNDEYKEFLYPNAPNRKINSKRRKI